MLNARPSGPRASLAWLAALLLALVATTALAGANFEILSANTRLRNDSFMLNARIRYAFSDRALEALRNGVPLTMVVHVRVRPASAWVWTESLVDESFRYRIRYKPLSESYLVTQLPGGAGRSYVSREAAISALGEIRDLHLIHTERLTPGVDYEVMIRVSLDVEQLPLPLRPMAYLHPEWKLTSDWTRWPLKP